MGMAWRKNKDCEAKRLHRGCTTPVPLPNPQWETPSRGCIGDRTVRGSGPPLSEISKNDFELTSPDGTPGTPKRGRITKAVNCAYLGVMIIVCVVLLLCLWYVRFMRVLIGVKDTSCNKHNHAATEHNTVATCKRYHA